MVLAAPLLMLAYKGDVLGRYSKAGKYLLKKVLKCSVVAQWLVTCL